MVEKCDECSVHFQNHKQIIIDKVENFLSRQVFADMTLVCGGGKKIKVHRAVLAACSPYFEEILLDIEDQNYPVFILNDIPEGIMTLLLKFIYRGKTNIPRNLKQLFLKIAKQLQIRGLGHEAVITSQDEYSALLTNRQNSEDIASSATSSAGLISVVRGQHQEQIRKLPLKIITDTGEKVINPFTIKQLRVNETESDSSSSSSEDLFKPSSSKPANEKVAVSSKVPNTIDSDSDIELIEDDPAITVLNNTSNPANEKVAVSSKVPNTIDSDSDIELIEDDPAITVLNNTSNTTQWFTCVEYESDDGDVVPSLPKRGKSPNKRKSSPLPNKRLPNQNSNNQADQNLSEGSESPVLITPNRRVAQAMSKLKDENSNLCIDSKFLEQSFESLARFCVICRRNKKNLEHHVKRCHAASLKMSYTCKTCSKIFYMKHTLDVHKCKSNKV